MENVAPPGSRGAGFQPAGSWPAGSRPHGNLARRTARTQSAGGTIIIVGATLMKWLFRPSILALLSVLLAVGAALVALWPRPREIKPAEVAENDREVAWLYTATNASTWERLVTAVGRSVNRLRQEHPDLQVTIDDRTFPLQTTSVSELALTVRHGDARLLLRWYKLTSDQKASQWIEALCHPSRRPPLAIIGGSSSDAALDLAESLQERIGAGMWRRLLCFC